MDAWAKQRLADLKAAAPAKRAKRELFIRVQFRQATEVCAAVGPANAFVWILLLHMAFTARSLTFSCRNELMAKCGIDRRRKGLALRALEAAGWLTLSRPGPRKAPVVTLFGVSLPG